MDTKPHNLTIMIFIFLIIKNLDTKTPAFVLMFRSNPEIKMTRTIFIYCIIKSQLGFSKKHYLCTSFINIIKEQRYEKECLFTSAYRPRIAGLERQCHTLVPYI